MSDSLSALEEKLELAKEALWYIRWALIFSSSAIIVLAIAVIEMFRDNNRTALIVDSCAIAMLLISMRLRRKSREYRRKAFGSE